jgi:hypothetical protein
MAGSNSILASASRAILSPVHQQLVYARYLPIIGCVVYESKADPPLATADFTKRLLMHALVATTLLVGSLGIGVFGYCYFEGLSVLDAFLNAAMLLGGMGPVNAPVTSGGKAFAGLYALYAGLVFIVSAGLIFTPIVHRILHKFHWSDET